jgi:hypothetical protein
VGLWAWFEDGPFWVTIRTIHGIAPSEAMVSAHEFVAAISLPWTA